MHIPLHLNGSYLKLVDHTGPRVAKNDAMPNTYLPNGLAACTNS